MGSTTTYGNHGRRRLFLWGLASCLLVFSWIHPLAAQQVSFGLYAGEDLFLTPLVPDELDFGVHMRDAGQVVIDRTDEEVVVIEIEGVAYLDVTVTLTPPTRLTLTGEEEYLNDPIRSMPLNVRMAYYNRGQPNIDIPTARQQSIEVSGHTATFQVRQRPGGPPGPPPTPPHSGYTPPMAKAYLFIYGDITIGSVNAGPYSGNIDISVEYTTF